jgi:O-acetyl-ADP-ribose deacetylase (regulator of RNase III)
MDRAARIAVAEIRKFLEHDSRIEKVILVCFGRAAVRAHEAALRERT